MVLEDTSELLRAQKAAAWHEVARRIAHEFKNPLTPIALSAERIGRSWTAARHGFAAHPSRMRAHHLPRSGIVRRWPTSSRGSPVSPPRNQLLCDLNQVVGKCARKFSSADWKGLTSDEARTQVPLISRPDSSSAWWSTWSTTPPRPCMIPRSSGSWCAPARRPRRNPWNCSVADTGCGISASGQRKALPSLFFDQGTRHRPGPRHREPYSRGTWRAVSAWRTIGPAGARFYLGDIPVAVAAEAEAKAAEMPAAEIRA